MCKFTTIILLTITLSIFSTKADAQTAEVKLLKSLNNTNQTFGFSKFISNTTTFTSFGTPIVMGAVALFEKDDELMKNALYVGISIGVDGVLTQSLKHTVSRMRPYAIYSDITNRDPQNLTKTELSFPSGHTSLAFTTATALTLKYPKWYIIAPSYLWACSVGYSRLNLGVHYPSDVVAGALLGAGSAFLTYKVNDWFWKKRDNKQLINLDAWK